jgi:hypothetical protein
MKQLENPAPDSFHGAAGSRKPESCLLSDAAASGAPENAPGWEVKVRSPLLSSAARYDTILAQLGIFVRVLRAVARGRRGRACM